MAIIGKIRNRSGLLVGFVFVALAIFVLSDLLGSKNRGGADPNSMVAGEVFGEEIPMREYEQRVNIAVENDKQNMANQGMEYNDQMSDRTREQVWNQMVENIIFKRELQHFYDNISKEELNDMLYGDNIAQVLREAPMFKNPMGQFSVDSVISLRRRVDASAEGKQWWVETIEKPLKENRKITKYFNLISKGLYVTKAEAERDNVDRNRKYNIRYVAQLFNTIPDSTVKVTDEEVREYYNKNKNRKKYENLVARRDFSYVEFVLRPTEQDAEEARKQAENLYARFKEAKNDSVFVMTHAETKMFNGQFSAPGTYPASVDSIIQQSDSGAVVGPYLDGDYWKIVKIRGIKYEEQAKVAHILIGYDKAERYSGPSRTKEQAKKLADSLLTALKKGSSMEELTNQYSNDRDPRTGMVNNGGVYDWFNKEIGFTQKFKDFAFAAKEGEYKVVETEFGYHVMKGFGQRRHKLVKAAVVDVKIRPLRDTDMAARAKAVDFYSKIKESSQFQEVAQKEKLLVMTKEVAYNQTTVDGNNGSRQLVNWVQRANEGDISDKPILLKGSAARNPYQMQMDPNAAYDRWLVVKLDNVKAKGAPEFDDVKEIMKLEVIREKKGQMLAEKMKGNRSIDQLAKDLNTNVGETQISFSSSTIPGLEQAGTEYAVVGAIFSMKKAGDVSVPLKGKNGVYVVMLTNVTEAAPMANVEEQRKMLTGILRGTAQSSAYTALRELAKIDDRRQQF